MKILVPVDGSPFSNAALNEVASRPWPPFSQIKLVSAYEVPITATPEVWIISDEYFPTLEQIARERAETIVETALATLAKKVDKSVRVSGEVLAGPPREVILDEAERWKADLVVMGSHGYGSWRRFMLGSVSQAVVSHAKCSVEVVHRRKDSDTRAA
ncbi:MAG TPA: universal stress protein [Pyrinomonadaceae bacterium]|nr:universal stress protein [Pyrinomonadaceae bacterium]